MADGVIEREDFDAIPWNEMSSGSALVRDPLVSVLMITRNHAAYVAQAIESVIAQRCDFKYEILIGEDCSDDGTLEVCESFLARYPGVLRLITSKSNVGMHRNLARLWYRARGRFIALLEGDDYWTDPCKLAMQVVLMQTLPAVSMCGSYTRKIVQGEDGNWVDAGFVGPPTKKDSYAVTDLIPSYSFHTSSVMVRKECIVFPRWFWDVYCADRPLYLLCAEVGPVALLPEVTSVYRLHSEGIWSPIDAMTKSDHSVKLFRKLNEYFGYRYDRLINATLGDILWSYMAEAMRAGDDSVARAIYRKAIVYRIRSAPFRNIRTNVGAFVRLFCPAWLGQAHDAR